MKTIVRLFFAFACISMLMSCSKSDDALTGNDNQFKSSETKSVVYKNLNLDYWAPVYCDGVMIDELSGVVNCNVVAHYVKGDLKWYMYHWNGTLTATSGEVFAVHETDKVGIPLPGVYTYHFNLIGDMGSHYINTCTLNMDDWSITVEKSKCPGN